jgi:hypothetical protein
LKAYGIHARFAVRPAVDWREQLADLLGCRPRRIGGWAERGLYGALKCLESGAEKTLAEHAALLVSSQHGPALALRDAVSQAREGLPLPLTFLQTQPSQLLAALSVHLQWRGDARFITHPDPLSVLVLALAIADSHTDGLLIGWVNELETQSNLWMRLLPVADFGGVWHDPRDFATLVQQASHLRMGPSGLQVIIAQ